MQSPNMHANYRFHITNGCSDSQAASDQFFLGSRELASTLFNLNIELLQETPKCVLSIQAGIDEISLFVLPFGQAAVVICFLRILNDERNNFVMQTFL